MKRHDKLAETIPYGTLGILALESSRDMGKRVNDYIVDWRNDRAQNHATAASFAGYNRDSFIIDSACPRFGSGEAKGIIRESVRGQDLYILVDVCNYNLTYTVCGQTNHMSPDDHYQDLKRIIAAVAKQDESLLLCLSYMRAASTEEVHANHSIVPLHFRNLHRWVLRVLSLLMHMTLVFRMPFL